MCAENQDTFCVGTFASLAFRLIRHVERTKSATAIIIVAPSVQAIPSNAIVVQSIVELTIKFESSFVELHNAKA